MQVIKKKLSGLPRKPGVYIFRNPGGEVIYVGKARDLKNRISQYFHKEFDGRPQIPFMVHDAGSLEHIITDNELESLFLENTLIKKYQPKYNIKLRDDKNYAFIKIDFETEIPQIYVVRNPDSKNAKYFGPYSSAMKIRETLRIIRKIFSFCANNKTGAKPCFYYYLHRCPGVCIGKISVEEYKKNNIKKIMIFLSGKIAEIKKHVSAQMEEAAGNRQFEKAAKLRDQLGSLEIIEERQKVIFATKVNWDFVSVFETADKAVANVFLIRDGRLADKKSFILENVQNQGAAQIIGAFMQIYYLENTDKPREIYVQEIPENLRLIKKNFAGKIIIKKPTRGKKLGIIRLGAQNAREYFENWAMDQASEISRTTLALDELKKILGLQKIPLRIEAFDVSNIHGTNSVASMVVFENAKPKKSDYRKFKIASEGEPNDFAMMREALSRRFNIKHAAHELEEDHDRQSDEKAAQTPENASGNTVRWPLPDLLVIDGGKGQLGVARKVLSEKNLKIPAIGLAKREEEIFVPGKSDPIRLPKSDYALQLLQRLRDEAHRFAITFHKKLRSKQSYKSFLDSVPGIGPKKKKLLISKFGTVSKIKQASAEELSKVIGASAAAELKKMA